MNGRLQLNKRYVNEDIATNQSDSSNDCVEHIWPNVIIKGQNVKTFKRPKEMTGQKDPMRWRQYRVVWHKSLWFSDECNRKSSEMLLKSAKNGTFIVRKCSKFSLNGCYVLSIVVNQNTCHCLINPYNNGFGFTLDRVFKTLEDLVLHYRDMESLAYHNDVLNTYLLYPAFHL